MKLGLYWNYATRSLLRGGQRTILAVFCIAVGVMAIVGLQLVGQSINTALTGNIVAANGGDIRITSSFIPLSSADYAKLQTEKSNGKISDYAASQNLNFIYSPDNGDPVFGEVIAGTSNYPLVGQPFFTNSSSSRLQDIVKGNDVAIENKLLDQMKAKVGDTVAVKLEDGRTFNAHIVAAYKDGGAFRGKAMLASYDTLAAIQGANGKPVTQQYSAFYVTVPNGNVDAAKNDLNQLFTTASFQTAQDLLKQQQDNVSNIRLFLQIVGLVALFIGGIGIINTMQVLLRRRRTEIAMLKTSGYQVGDLYAMFGIEAGLLGLVGGVVGSLLGLGVSNLLSSVITNSFAISLSVVADPFTIGSGVVIGFATALIFGLLPIVQASQVRPLSVLREIDDGAFRTSFLVTGALLVILAALFIVLASTILGDVTKGIAVVIGGSVLIFGLAGVFGLLIWAISKLPVYERPSARILLWILLGFGTIIGGLFAGGLLIGIGAVAGFATKFSGVGLFAVIALGAVGIILIGATAVFFMISVLDGGVMFLPRTAKSTFMLALRNIGRQQVRTTATLTALFVGVFAIGVVVVLGQGVKDTINSFFAAIQTRNVFVTVPPAEESTFLAKYASYPGVDPSKTTVTYAASQQGVVPVQIAGQTFQSLYGEITDKGYFNQQKKTIGRVGLLSLTIVQGYELNSPNKNYLPPDTTSLTNAKVIVQGRNLNASDAGTNNILVSEAFTYSPINMQLGDKVVLAAPDPAAPGDPTKTKLIEMTVVGFTSTQSFGFGITADKSVVQQIAGDNLTATYQVKVDPDKVTDFRKVVTNQIPNTTVVSLGDVTALIESVLNQLIVMLLAIASLALIAGLIIIANAVALSMLERRREIGILKTVGHSTGTVMTTVLIENALIGFLGALVSMLLVSGVIFLTQHLPGFTLKLNLNPGLTLLIIFSTSIVTAAISALVAYDAARVRPLQVLRYE